MLLVNNNNMLLVNFSILTVFYWEKNKEEKQDKEALTLKKDSRKGAEQVSDK